MLITLSADASEAACFFFSSRRRHTRCSRDWSSDVCSSDLFQDAIRSEKNDVSRIQADGGLIVLGIGNKAERHALQGDGPHLTIADQQGIRSEIGRASCRERV